MTRKDANNLPAHLYDWEKKSWEADEEVNTVTGKLRPMPRVQQKKKEKELYWNYRLRGGATQNKSINKTFCDKRILV